MLTEQTLAKLYDLKLAGMAEAYQTQRTCVGMDDLSFDERFCLLVDVERTHQTNRALQGRLKADNLRCSYTCVENPCVENLDYHHRNDLERETVHQLVDCV